MTRSNGWKAHFDQHLVEGLRIWLFTSTFSRVTQTFSSEYADMWTYKYFLAVWCWRESRGGMIKEIIDSFLQPRAWCCGLGVVVLNICFGWEPQRWEDEIQRKNHRCVKIYPFIIRRASNAYESSGGGSRVISVLQMQSRQDLSHK